MISPDLLAKRIRSTGFSCTRCAGCCRCTDTDSGLVLVFPGEVRAIIDKTGLSWEEIAEPYPEKVRDMNGGSFALCWCLKRTGDACRFLYGGKCTIYESRPWICHTYPFMLDGDELKVSECDGLGQPVSEAEAHRIAGDLIRRRQAEDEEASLIRAVLAKKRVPAGSFAVVDSDGVEVIDG